MGSIKSLSQDEIDMLVFTSVSIMADPFARLTALQWITCPM